MPPVLSHVSGSYVAHVYIVYDCIDTIVCILYTIEEVWRKKPRQTDVVVLWGKFAAHMLLFRL